MKKLLQQTTLLMCLIAACTPQENSPAPTTDPAPGYVPLPTRISVDLPTIAPTQTATAVPPTESAPPAWVTEFSEPILIQAAGQYPVFQEDFNSQLNRGWFYLIDANAARPYFAHLEENALLLKIPDAAERHDVMAYSPHLARTNFVLSLDFKFGKTEPNDVFQIQFKQGTDQFIRVDLSKNETTSIFWNLHNHWKSSSGLYDHFGPALVNVVLILSDHECALYINHDPLGHLEACRAGPWVTPLPEDLSFHLLSTSGNPATVTVDNVMIWDLDQDRARP